jgi:hypothetical protein
MDTVGEPRSWWFRLLTIFIFPVVLALWLWIPGCLSNGDYAPVNALFSGLAFAGLIIAILSQRKELQSQRRELARTREEMQGQKRQMEIQNFENKFFQMLAMWREIRDDFAHNYLYRSFLGFEGLLQEVLLSLEISLSQIRGDGMRLPVQVMIDEGIQAFYGRPRDSVSIYLRALYNVLKVVDEADIGFESQKFYSEIVTIQLSQRELVVVFYDCLSESGHAEFKPLIEKYSLLKYLDDSGLIAPEHCQLYNPSAFK